MSSLKPWLLASGNSHKIREFQEIFLTRGLTLCGLPLDPSWPPAVEDGGTFLENAEKKALHYAALAGKRVLADDSGLCVEALSGRPGILSARYAGASATDAANLQKLLDALNALTLDPAQRKAYFQCSLVLAEPGRVLRYAEGRVEGCILTEPRGTTGFGYDPIFYYPPLQKSFAELGAAEKNIVSHRYRACMRLLVEDAVRRG